MKTRDKRWKTILAAALFPLAIGYFLWTFFLGGSPAPPSAPAGQSVATPANQPAQAPAPQTRTRARRFREVNVKASLDPRLRLDLLRSSEEAIYEGKGRNIFEPYQPPPPPERKPQVAETQKPQVEQPPSPPPRPPIPLKFFGFASRPGEPKAIFLQSGEDVFVAREGEIVNRRYRVVRIGANSVEIEDVMDNHRENIPLTAG